MVSRGGAGRRQHTQPPSGKTLIYFVASDPKAAPRGYGSGTVYATTGHRVCALVLRPVAELELRLLLSPADARALGDQLRAAADKLDAGGSDIRG